MGGAYEEGVEHTRRGGAYKEEWVEHMRRDGWSIRGGVGGAYKEGCTHCWQISSNVCQIPKVVYVEEGCSYRSI